MRHVRDEILKQTSIETFKSVPIKEALESLSPFNINKDLSPDVITSDLSKILKIVRHGEKEHIKVEHEELNKLMTRVNENSGGGGGLNLGFIKIGGSGKKDKETQMQNEVSSKSLRDHLVEINSDEKNDVEWKQEGEKIVPKNLKVAKLSKGEFSKKLTFKNIKQKLEKTFFQEKFDLIGHKPPNECLETINCNTLKK